MFGDVMEKIYLVEDDDNIRKLVCYSLSRENYDVTGFAYPSEFWNTYNKVKPDLIMLDIMLPEEDGLSILKQIRNNNSEIPVIMLTAKGSEFDKVTGLDMGADDYISKPFGTMELISRIKALLRRSEPQSDENVFKAKNLTLRADMREVTADGRKVALTLKEYELLYLLIKNKGKVFTRDELLRIVWGFDFSGESRTVDVHIRTLRSKLGSCGELIETVRGVGYRIGENND